MHVLGIRFEKGPLLSNNNMCSKTCQSAPRKQCAPKSMAHSCINVRDETASLLKGSDPVSGPGPVFVQPQNTMILLENSFLFVLPFSLQCLYTGRDVNTHSNPRRGGALSVL
eukprot:Gregarina_sp_Poly_1__6739@NODE_362_length_9201_cov_168_054193_g292_i1_p7_GENE_NODE_362_length_9201_cov_168_054193_g292_i1NODE_362_length_9201_cov_168_054193_g292_i1_p7_ORF_typecomplete_len112_score0_01PXPV/PF12778_7/0_28_NODE_362_length_9201_cov_168_054193_g292_i176858020